MIHNQTFSINKGAGGKQSLNESIMIYWKIHTESPECCWELLPLGLEIGTPTHHAMWHFLFGICQQEGRITLSQIMDFLPKHRLRQYINRYKDNCRVCSFTRLDQFMCVAFAQLTCRESLPDIEWCLAASIRNATPWVYGKVSWSIVADANKRDRCGISMGRISKKQTKNWILCVIQAAELWLQLSFFIYLECHMKDSALTS